MSFEMVSSQSESWSFSYEKFMKIGKTHGHKQYQARDIGEEPLNNVCKITYV